MLITIDDIGTLSGRTVYYAPLWNKVRPLVVDEVIPIKGGQGSYLLKSMDYFTGNKIDIVVNAATFRLWSLSKIASATTTKVDFQGLLHSGVLNKYYLYHPVTRMVLTAARTKEIPVWDSHLSYFATHNSKIGLKSLRGEELGLVPSDASLGHLLLVPKKLLEAYPLVGNGNVMVKDLKQLIPIECLFGKAVITAEEYFNEGLTYG